MTDKQLFDDLENVLKAAKIGFTDATGGALHRLKITNPSIDVVKDLIEGIPDALSFENEKGQLPIQSAVWNRRAVKYIPILAKVGIKDEVGGRGMRGGLLVADPVHDDDLNTLQLLANVGISSNPIPDDTARLEVMKELRKDNLFLKKDLKEHNLLFWSCHLRSKMRFEYLAEWDPDCLMTCTFKDLPLSHAIIKHRIDIRHMFLKTLLFQKDNSRKTAFERAIEKHGIEKTFLVIKQCIPTDTIIPILHHVIKDAPKFMNDFSIRYPLAIYLRDEDGRSVVQAELAEGSKIFASDGLFFMRMKDDEIAELDPVTKQYPFLTCASRETSDLSTIFVLLSKNPSLLEKHIERTTDEFAEEARSRKRKRDTSTRSDDDEVLVNEEE